VTVLAGIVHTVVVDGRDARVRCVLHYPAISDAVADRDVRFRFTMKPGATHA